MLCKIEVWSFKVTTILGRACDGPSTQLIDPTSCVKMGDTTNGAEELVDISSYHMLSAGKNWRSYKPSLKLDKKLVACAPVGEAVK